MKAILTNITKVTVGIILLFLIGTIVFTNRYSYKIDFEDQEKYKHLFNRKYADRIDTLYFARTYRKSDCYYEYNCLDYQVGIIEVKSLKDLSLSSIQVNNNIDLDDILYYPSYVMDDDSKLRPKLINYWNLTFENQLKINLNENSNIEETFKGDAYWGFIGTIGKMSFSNTNWKHLMQFHYRGNLEKTLLVFRRTENGLYIIIVNSKNDFGLKVLEMFDL